MKCNYCGKTIENIEDARLLYSYCNQECYTKYIQEPIAMKAMRNIFENKDGRFDDFWEIGRSDGEEHE
jgi:hypothetical protein